MSDLVWTVKGSFVKYILGSAGGTVVVEDGAEGEAEGPYRFVADGDGAVPAQGGAPLKFRGSIRFRGHGGLLDLPIRDPWIEAAATGTVLTIVDPDDAAARVPFVSVADWNEVGGETLGGVTMLTADGADLFFGPYSEGTEFDAPTLQPAR